jgi:dihydroorotate dehydrogenase
MGLGYERLVRPALFRLDAERAHELAILGMSVLGSWPGLCRALERAGHKGRLDPVRLFGLEFPNRIGLAAGFDKDARGWPAAAALGFGHVEIGTVTARVQPGNPKPRLFRYPRDEAVVNRMGFNNEGASRIAARLARQRSLGPRRIPVGVNLGKSKAADLDEATQDYLASFASLADFADYLVLNVSSPNTPGLRELQDEWRLRELLTAISGANRSRAAQPGRRRVPLLLKIAPDLSFDQIDRVLSVAQEQQLDGIIATNTTLGRPPELAHAEQAGGLSGAPLRARATEVVAYVAKATSGRLPIIAVGGIMDADGAKEKLDAGAVLIQLYTGLIYRGPFFARELARKLSPPTPGLA